MGGAGRPASPKRRARRSDWDGWKRRGCGFPSRLDAKVALASACLEAELPLCCGEMLQEAAAYDNKYASEAAECFRRAGVIDRALYLNGTVVDDAVQGAPAPRAALEQQDFALATSLGPRLSRLGILRETTSRSPTHWPTPTTRTGRTPRRSACCVTLRDPKLFQQATKLREAMQEAESQGAPAVTLFLAPVGGYSSAWAQKAKGVLAGLRLRGRTRAPLANQCPDQGRGRRGRLRQDSGAFSLSMPQGVYLRCSCGPRATGPVSCWMCRSGWVRSPRCSSPSLRTPSPRRSSRPPISRNWSSRSHGRAGHPHRGGPGRLQEADFGGPRVRAGSGRDRH